MQKINLLALLLLAGNAATAVFHQASAQEPIPSAIVPLATTAQINDVASGDGALVAVGERGIILRAQKDGSWKQVPSPVSSLLTSVYFIGSHGWAVGHDAVILRTLDSGESWSIVHREPTLNKPLLDVYFTSAEQGFAIGAFGLFLQTQDGGDSWQPVEVEAFLDLPPHLNAISELNDGSLLIVGEMGMYAHSEDGVDWRVGSTGYEGSLFTIVPVGRQGAVVAGMRGNAFHAVQPRDDAWKIVDLKSTKSVFGGDEGENGEVFLVAGQELLELTNNKGQTNVKRVGLEFADELQKPLLTSVLYHGDSLVVSSYSGVLQHKYQ